MRRARPSPRVLAALRLVRAGNVAVSFVGTIVGGLVVRSSGLSAPLFAWGLLAAAAASTALVTAGGNVLNDVLDVEGDRTNHPERPLVTGAISVRGARALTGGLFAAGIAFGIPVALAHPLDAVILAVAVGTLVAYEFRFKRAGFVGNLLVALLTGLVFLYGGGAVGVPLVVLPFAAMAFLATVSREVIKDTEDLAGDVGRSTLPRTRGVPVATLVARAAIGAAIALSVLPVLWFLAPTSAVGVLYLGLVAAADATFVVSVVYLPDRLHFEQTTSKAAMTIALLAFVAVAFR